MAAKRTFWRCYFESASRQETFESQRTFGSLSRTALRRSEHKALSYMVLFIIAGKARAKGEEVKRRRRGATQMAYA